MKYNELVLPKQKKAKRVGRGISAGGGKTAGRGTKGQGARKSPNKAGFEGGQMPIYMRLPKLRGFKSHRSVPEVVYTGQLEGLKAAIVDNKSLYEAGLVSSPNVSVKVITTGELKSKKTIKLQQASTSAIQMIEKAGGTFERAARIPRPKTKDDKKDRKTAS
jgi:large subunit ribosomal protein L15